MKIGFIGTGKIAGAVVQAICTSELVFLALRPPVFREVVSDLVFREDQSVISVIPFTTLENIQKNVAPSTSISRAIPLPTVTTHVCPIPVYKPSEILKNVLNAIGQPFEIESEEELHTIWTLTCLISPYYDMLDSLAKWAMENSVKPELANKYVAGMFNTLTNAAHISENPDFKTLSHHAATPGGLNERNGTCRR